MQTPVDDILTPDFTNPLEYFSSQTLSRMTPPIYADDPWTTSSNASFDFNNSSTYDAVDRSFMLESDVDRPDTGFGLALTANNVLLGVDVPDVYLTLYSKSNPRNEKVDIKTLQILLNLAGLSASQQQKVMSLVVTPGESCVTRNEFNAYLALIACAQKNMDVSLETVYRYEEDLPVPVVSNIDSYNIRTMTQPDVSSKTHSGKKEANSKDQQDPWQKKNNPLISNANSAAGSDVEEQQQAHQNRSRHQQEQDAMNQWFRDLDHITVTRSTEKEGFLFKHVNYEVETEKRNSKVLRRFSDFWWLWKVLLRRYPFRVIPHLPPKKLGGRDDMFEERRRKGLVRFINAVARHPVLGRDEVVIAFLSHPSEMNSWRRANQPSLDEEFVREPHNIAYLERIIPMDLDDRVTRMKKRLAVSIQQYERMCLIMHQMNRLKRALGTDYIRYSVTLNSVSELDKNCWVPDCQGCPAVIHGYESIVKSMHQAGSMLNKQAGSTSDSIVESLKRQRDLLEAFRELLDRRDRMSTVSNETLSRQMAKYKKGQIQPYAAHDSEVADQPSPLPSTQQYNEATGGLTLDMQRDVFIKYCFMSEMTYLHKQQASVSVMYNNFVRDEVRYARQWSDHWKQLEAVTSEMPNAPHEFN